MSTISLKQLDADIRIEEMGMREIAGLIYDTDPYIYPAMFVSRENALLLIPELIRSGDPMFRFGNMLVAQTETQIIGLVLWCKGALSWKRQLYDKCIEALDVEASPFIDDVQDRYFKTYEDTPDTTVSIINVCTNPAYRQKGIGRSMMERLIKDNSDQCFNFELFALKENYAAVHLYQSLRFSITKEFQGFSVDHRNLPCYQMVRTVTK